jgi:hypothetical protein
MGGDVPVGPPWMPPIGPLSCDSTPCISARAELVNAGNVVRMKCAQVASIKATRDIFAAIAAVFATLAVALLAAAAAAGSTIIVLGPFSFALAAALVAAAIVMAALAALLFVLAGIFEVQMLVVEGELGTAKGNFVTATNHVTASCPTSCWGDLTMPSC